MAASLVRFTFCCEAKLAILDRWFDLVRFPSFREWIGISICPPDHSEADRRTALARWMVRQ